MKEKEIRLKKFDMHVHSKHSLDINSREEIQKMVKRAKKLGLAGIAITDHNNAKAFKEIDQIRKVEKEILIIKGEEIIILENGKMKGEVLCYFLQEEIKQASLEEVIDSARRQDALVSIAHPFDVSRIPFIEIGKNYAKADAIEAFNSRAGKKEFNDLALAFAEEKKMPVTAGSDAHSLPEIGRAGIECNAESIEELRKAILKKNAIVFGSRIGNAAKINLKALALLRRLKAGK